MKANVEEALLDVDARQPGGGEHLAVREEVKKQLSLAVPLIAGALLQNVIQMISVMYVGHLGELPLAGASMANSFTSVTGLTVLLGMASALDTLCGQAYGARQYNLLGIYKQRAMLLLTIVSIPLAVVWFYTGDILLLFGQDADIAAEAGAYARWMIPAIFGYGLMQCHVRFLQTQNIVHPVMASAGAAAACHLVVCWALVYGLGMGSKGAALSNAISYWLNLAVLAVYVRVSSACKETWTGFSTEAFHDVLSFFRLAIPSALMVCLEMWSFELVVLLSGLLPNPKLETSVLSISLNTSSFVWMVPFGLSCAISTRVSNELGAGRPQAARLAVRVVLFLAVAEGLIVGLILVCARYIWGHAYSDVEEVVGYVARMMLVIAVTIFFDGIMTVLSGVARGCGWQKIGACINLGAYYIVGIPSAYLLGFVLCLGGMGLWMGINCGLLVQLLLLMIVTMCTNWDKESLIQMISLMFVGHLGELPLAGASLANSFAAATGFSLLLGMASALDTLCGQAFGARQYHLLGIYKQRAMLLLTAVSVPLAVVWFYTGEILLLFGQGADIAAEAGAFARWMIPALFAYGPLQCHVRFLQTQNIVVPVMSAAGATAAFHLVGCWVLVFGLGMGSKGAALGNAVSYWINVTVLAVYVRVSPDCKKTWTGFSMEAFRDGLGFIGLAVPSSLMVCLEWWSFELLVLLSGLLPNPQLETSVLSITKNTASCLFMVPYGLGAAISTRVSNELGAGRPRAARLAVRVVMFLAVSEGLVMGSVLICVRYIWGHASDEEEVVTYVARMLLLIAVSNFFDGIQCVLSGVARGCGWQKIGAYVNLGAFYIVGVPAAYLIAFVLHVSGMGLWTGIICGIVVQVVLLLIITLCTDWQKEATKAKNRVFDSSLPTDLVAT